MPSRRSCLHALFGAALLVPLLAGCGGGSDSEPPPIQTPSPVAPIVTPPPPVTTVAAVVPRFAYAANASDFTISIYAVDAQSGQLRANGYAVAGVGVREVAVDPSNSFVYALVGVGTNAGVFVARIDAETGQLTPVAGSPFATGNVPEGIAVHPTGPYVYVTDSNSDSVFAYAIDSSSGAVTPVAGSPFAAGDFPKSVAVDPTGKFVYVTNKESANVSAFRIDAATGALTLIAGSPFVSGFYPNSVVVNSSGTVAYVVNGGEFIFTSTISVYSIDQSTGALTLTASPLIANGSSSEAATINRADTFLYVANGGSNNVSAYAIGANGALTEVAGSPYPTGRGALSVVADPSGKFVYVATGRLDTNDIAAFSVDQASGVLTPLAATPFIAARGNPRSLAIAAGNNAVEFRSQFVYTANTMSNDLSAYAIDSATGALTAVTGAPFAAGSGPIGVTIDPLNRYVYAANLVSNNISAFRIDGATGALTPVPGSPFLLDLSGAGAITVEPSGRFVYVTGVCAPLTCFGSAMAAYSIDASSGALTQVAGSPYALSSNLGEGGSAPNAMTVDPRGRIIYVVAGNATVALDINAVTGALTPVSGSPFDTGQSGLFLMTVHPAGKFVYGSLSGGLYNSIYKIDSIIDGGLPPSFILFVVTGALESAGITPVLPNPYALTVDPTGRFAYALDGSVLRGFGVNGQSGQLTALSTGPVATGGSGSRLAPDFSGKFIYTLNTASNSVSAFTINAADGSLSVVPGSPFAGGSLPRSIAVSGRVQ